VNQPVEFAVIGGGIVGAAVAHELAGRGRQVLIVEKEDRLAAHQSGRNSGEIHSGIFYRPGTLKARLAVEGSALMKRFCRERAIPIVECGKVIVATCESDLVGLGRLEAQAEANGVPGVERVGPERLREIEPHAAGIAALRLPGVAITDFAAVTRELGRSARVALGTRVLSIHGTTLRTTSGEIRARRVVACAGLFSDRLARGRTRIVPFRGEYADLKPERRRLARGLIYPVPDPRFPFLGVHVTRRLSGEVEAGPNAVLALKREGYSWGEIDWRDVLDYAAFPGFWRMAAAHARLGLREVARSLSLRRLARAVRRLIPEVRDDDLVPGRSGVRAQALDPDGRLVDDFRIVRRGDVTHVVNAPSPAATAALAIAKRVVEGMMPL
jgi:L-2-hydroxyglutarate oxidase